jgi:hypothetical protein
MVSLVPTGEVNFPAEDVSLEVFKQYSKIIARKAKKHDSNLQQSIKSDKERRHRTRLAPFSPHHKN